MEKDSAVLGYRNEMSASMNADHNTISKYESQFDSNFIKLKDTLNRILPKSESSFRFLPSPPSLTLQGRPHDVRKPKAETVKEIQGVLGIFDDINDDLYAHKRNVPAETGAWLASEKGFSAWSQATRSTADPRFYWLFGLPGSGKTVISTIIINQLQERDQMVQCHFFSEAHRAKRTISYALRSIATQLALGDESFRKALMAMHLETGLSFCDQGQTFHSIWEKIFEGIIFRLRFRRPLIWVLDGIDEADAPDILLANLSQIKSQTPIKILFSSRPLKAISRFDSAQIRSYFLREHDTVEDIRAYTAGVLRQVLPDDDNLVQSIVNQTLKHSSGSFLWVKLALEALEENWHTEDDIRAVLSEFPNGMVPMYKRMLGKIDGQMTRSRNIAQRILTWATCGWRPLRLDELQTALEPEFSNFINLEDTITQICGNFTAITTANSQKHVSLIHKTARDFLTKGDRENGAAPFINLQDGHRHLALVCLRYLSSEHWRRHFDFVHVGARSDTSNRLVIAETGHPLLGYASCYWAYHVSKSPVNSPELLEVLKTFLSKYFLSWVQAIALSGNLRYLIRSAQYLKAYVKRHSRSNRDGLLSLKAPPELDVEWITSWAVDFIHIVGKFGSALIRDPQSVYRQLPQFCPKNSMIGKTYGIPKQDALVVSGLQADVWDDCLASVSVGEGGYGAQVLATDTCFITLLRSSGTIIVWSTETCEQLRTIHVGGYVQLMALNKTGTAVATVAFNNYSVWELLTGKRLYTWAKPPDAMVLDLRFGAADHELVVALSSNKIQRIDMETGRVDESVIPTPTDPDFTYYGSPWRMTLSPDLTKIAAAWRGRPPLIWDLALGGVHGPRKCRVTSPSDPICGPELLRWHPDGEALFILCQSTSVVEWRIYEDQQREWPHISARELVVSGDGNYLLSSDNTGTVSVWNLPRLGLVYRLVAASDDYIADLAFSPGAQRFYDVRESACNVWEPDALVRVDEQDMDEDSQSSAGGTTILSEPTISRFGADGQLVTALALDGHDRYYCRGEEDGRVSIHDALSGKRLRKVYSHKASAAVLALCWSDSGKYILSCDDGGFVIAKRLQVKTEGTWGVFPVFDYRLSEPIDQFLFSASEQFLLISTPSADFVWDLKAKKEVTTRRWPERQSRRWIQHPLKKDVLVWISANEVRYHKWPTLDAVENAVVPSPPSTVLPSMDGLAISEPKTCHHDREPSRFVSWVSPNIVHRRYVLYATLPGDGSLAVSSTLSSTQLHLEFVDVLQGASQGGNDNDSNAQPFHDLCLETVAKQVKQLLGVYKMNLVFLDYDCWVCTWNMQDEKGHVTRHFFVPKDWVYTSTAHMAVVNAHGTLFCPRYGDVAVVRNGIRI